MDGSTAVAPAHHRVSDRTLRGLADGLGVLIVVCFAAQGSFGCLNRNATTAQTSWSTTGLLGALSVVGILLFPIVGLILARKVPRNWIGWIMLLIGLSIAVPFDGYAQYALLTRHGELPAGRQRGGDRRAVLGPADHARRRLPRAAVPRRPRAAGLAVVRVVARRRDGVAMLVVLTVAGAVRVPAEVHEPARDLVGRAAPTR